MLQATCSAQLNYTNSYTNNFMDSNIIYKFPLVILSFITLIIIIEILYFFDL